MGKRDIVEAVQSELFARIAKWHIFGSNDEKLVRKEKTPSFLKNNKVIVERISLNIHQLVKFVVRVKCYYSHYI